MLRSLALAVVLVALAPATAGAVIGERIVPFYDEADGVRVVDTPRGKVVRFDRTRAASKAWRRISGRKASVVCDTEGGASGSENARGERGRRVEIPADEHSTVCTIATKRQGGSRCYEDEMIGRHCVRAVVALNEAGRLHVEEVIASWDLLLLTALGGATPFDPAVDLDVARKRLGDKLVRLDGPSATPPPGAIGLWLSGEDSAVVVLTARGERRFLSSIGGVVSTNARGILTPTPPPLVP